MAKNNDTVRFTAEEIKARLARGNDQTNWAKINATTEADIEAAIAADPDDIAGEVDWTEAVLGVPPPKAHINIRVDQDVLDWFRGTGKGYQTRINNVLRAFVTSRQGMEHRKRDSG